MKQQFIQHTFLKLLLLGFVLLTCVGEAWGGNTWTGNVGVGKGDGTAKVEVVSDAVIGGGTKSTSAWASNTQTKQAKWSSTLSSTKGHLVFTASAGAGYTFEAWYTNPGCTSGRQTGNPYTTSSNKGGTLTYYAKFTPNTYTIAFNGNGSTGGFMSNQTIEKGGTETLNNNNFSKQYIVTYDVNGGSCAISSVTSTATFTGWATSASGAVTYADQASMSTFLNNNNGGTLNLYAVWSGMSSVTLPDATLENHVLDGWYSGPTKVGEPGDNFIPSSNVTLTAIWIEKYTPVMTGEDTSLKVGEEQLNAFYFDRVDNPVPHISVVSIDSINNGDGKVIEYDSTNNKIIAHNAGTATLYFEQAETSTIKYQKSATYTYEVSKHNPTFTWTNQTFYFNSTYNNQFTSSNSDTQITTSTTNDGAAEMFDGSAVNKKTLKTYNDTTATITISQEENYYWASKSQDYIVNNNKANNHVTFKITNANNSIFEINKTGDVSWDGAGYKFGDGGWTTQQDEVIIEFTGIPDKLTFTKTCDKSWGQLPINGDCHFMVYESSSNGNWGTPIWEYNQKEEHRDVTNVPQLNPNTRYLKLVYDGSVYGHFNNITVTELQYFRAQGPGLDFGDVHINEPEVKSFVVEHCNAGYQTEVIAPEHYLVSLDGTNFASSVVYSTNATAITGGEKMGSFTIYVKYLADEGGPFNDYVVVSNNLREDINYPVKGVTKDRLENPLLVSYDSEMWVESEKGNVLSSKSSDGAITTTTTDPTVAYYDITNNKIVAQNTDNQDFGEEDYKDVTITINQAESYWYKPFSGTYVIRVKKRENTLKTPFVTENSWSAIMNYGTGRYVRIESDNADVATCPIVVTPLTGQNYATYYDDQKAIYTVGPEGTETATWSVSQAENYKYRAAETKTMTVTIQAAAEGPCYVLNESEEKSFINGITDVAGHFGDEDVYEVTGPTNVLSFDAMYLWGGINESFDVKYFVVQYSVDGGNAWTEIARPDISTSYQHFSYHLDTIDGITHIRFGAYEGGTGFKFYKNVMITRKTYLNAEDVEVSSKGDGTPIYPGEVGHAILKIDYSLASGGTLHISNDNPSAFELSEAEITNVDCATNTAEVQITYHARTGVEGTDGTAEDVAHISIYNTTYSKSVTLTGVTTKRNQIGQWKEHIETLTVGTVVEDAYWATLSQQNGVTYTIVEGDAIEINSDNNLVAVKEGDVTIQAHVDGDGIYNSITSELFPIYVTSKYTQYIDWNQNLLHLTIGDDNVVLTAIAMSDIDGCTTNGSRPIVYYVKDGSDNVVKVVNDNELQVIGVGTVSVIASQAGGVDSDGHDYAPTSVEKKVVVRDPSAPCETYIYEQGEERRFDMGAVPFWKQNASQEIDFGGQEPESYTFEYKGEYKNRVMFDGTMSVEQYVNGAWSLVENLGKPEISTYKTASHDLSRNATKMRVSIHDAQGYHYFKDCQVKLAKYMEVFENGVQMSPQTLAFNILVNGSQSRTISVKYSNISGPLSFVLPEDAPFTLDKTALEGSCGDRGTIDLTITYVPTVIETDGVYTLTITDGVLTQQVELNATANLLECIYPETAPNTDWHTDENWSRGAVPNSSCRAILEHDVVITGSAYVYGITMDEGVHLTIAPTGALTVGAGGIVGERLLSENIVLEAGADGKTGALRIHPKAEAPNATVQFYSTIANSENSNEWKWQYIGTPVSNPDMNERIFYNCWLYKHDAATNTWDNAGNWNHMQPFLGYAFTRNDGKPNSYSRPSTGPLFAFMGKLNAPETKSLTLTVGAEGQNENHLANSWTAPIRVSKFTEDDLSGIDKKTIYYYPIDYRGNVEGLPPFSAKYTGSDVIPAMQGFFVLANENGAKLVLNYEKLIWDVNAINNEPLKAPSREREEQDELLSRVCINLMSADSIPDHLYLIEKEGEGFSREFTEGYDAPKYFVDGLPCIYTYETSGTHLAVSATDDVVGTYLAINTGASQNYTLTFSKVIGEGLGLRDLVTNIVVPITEGMQYAFTAPANSSPMLRFVVVEHEETPQWNNNNGGTSLEDVGGEFKIWQSGEILSVLGAGSHASLRIYDAAGKLVLSEFFNEATAINLNALPTGVYMVQVNDKTEKVLR